MVTSSGSKLHGVAVKTLALFGIVDLVTRFFAVVLCSSRALTPPTTTVVSRRSCSRATSPTGDTLPSRAFTPSLCRGTGLALLRAAGKVAEDGGERGAPAPTQWCHLGYLVTHWTSLILPMILVGRPAGVITSFLMFWVMGCWVSQAKSTS
jgi:hypothetical protein